ncbi:MAG: hypothetical protein ACO38D_08905, partial [Ilumatobacteraceae bacterium]
MTLTPLSESEIPHVVDLINRCNVLDGPNIRVDVEELRQELDSSLTERSRDVRVARLDTGRIVGIV